LNKKLLSGKGSVVNFTIIFERLILGSIGKKWDNIFERFRIGVISELS